MIGKKYLQAILSQLSPQYSRSCYIFLLKSFERLFQV